MKAFKIEKGIPVPAARKAGLSLALRAMLPGDSVWVPADHRLANVRAAVNVACARIFGSGNYTTRTDGKGVRAWRLK